MRFAPLGDQAVLVYFDDEATAVRFANALRAANPPWLQDVVPAYASVGVFFDADANGMAEVSASLAEMPLSEEGNAVGKRWTIPVCYEMGPDLAAVAEATRLPVDEVIRLHTGTVYAVFAIGFVPGFPYLGYLPERLCGVGRLASPRVRVEPGSVGITGRQTGIYPLPRPGGWHLIGRTPLTIVDVAEGFFPIRVGDWVKFTQIDEEEFRVSSPRNPPTVRAFSFPESR